MNHVIVGLILGFISAKSFAEGAKVEFTLSALSYYSHKEKHDPTESQTENFNSSDSGLVSAPWDLEVAFKTGDWVFYVFPSIPITGLAMGQIGFGYKVLDTIELGMQKSFLTQQSKSEKAGEEEETKDTDTGLTVFAKYPIPIGNFELEINPKITFINKKSEITYGSSEDGETVTEKLNRGTFFALGLGFTMPMAEGRWSYKAGIEISAGSFKTSEKDVEEIDGEKTENEESDKISRTSFIIVPVAFSYQI